MPEHLLPFGEIPANCQIAIARQALDAALALAAQIAEGPQQAMASIKALCRASAHNSQDEQLELEARQARIRPHFLFNTLNTGAALVHARPDETEQLLLDLADLFRAALGGPSEMRWGEESALIERYLEIESLRFRERLRVRWTRPEPMPNTLVPALSLQPLVENAIKHGIERIPGGGEIDIRIDSNDKGVVIVISNPVPSEPARVSTGHNVGLPASLAQIEAYTEGRGSVVARADGERFTVTVTLPAGV